MNPSHRKGTGKAECCNCGATVVAEAYEYNAWMPGESGVSEWYPTETSWRGTCPKCGTEQQFDFVGVEDIEWAKQ